MTTDYITSIKLVSQYNACEGCQYVTIEEDCRLDQKITLTPEVFAEIYRAARVCESLTAEEKGTLSHFDIGVDLWGAKLEIHLYICAADDMDYHKAIFEPLRKALYTEDDYCDAEITRKCYLKNEE